MTTTREPAATPSADVSRLRVPPHSAEAEQSLLGALLLDSAVFDRVSDVVVAGDFYRHENRTVFEAIAALAVAGKPADVVTVFDQLKSRASDAGGLTYINALAQSVTGSANARRYAEIIRERSLMRSLIALCDEGATAAFNQQGRTAAEVMEEVAGKFAQLGVRQQRVEPKAISALMVGAVDRYQEIAEGRRAPGLSTGLEPLDRCIGGLRPGKVYGIAARPSVGKSSLARSIAIHAAQQRATALILSMEMPQDEQADCIVAQLGRIDSSLLQTGKLAADDWSRMVDAVEEAAGLPLLLDEQGALTPSAIRAKARGVKNLGLLVVDYLQLCASTLKGKTTNDEVAEVSKSLKALALELRIPVIVLSQLNREADQGEPQLKHLRDSGAIEQDLDVAIFLWPLDSGEGDVSLLGCKVAKHRGGPKGRFALRFEKPIYRFTEALWPAAPPRSRKGADL